MYDENSNLYRWDMKYILVIIAPVSHFGFYSDALKPKSFNKPYTNGEEQIKPNMTKIITTPWTKH